MKNPVVNQFYYGKQSFTKVTVKSIEGRYVQVLYPGAKDCVPVPLAVFFEIYSETPIKTRRLT